jgi:hypothetical protein
VPPQITVPSSRVLNFCDNQYKKRRLDIHDQVISALHSTKDEEAETELPKEAL